MEGFVTLVHESTVLKTITPLRPTTSHSYNFPLPQGRRHDNLFRLHAAQSEN
jgi:hypothetical protein